LTRLSAAHLLIVLAAVLAFATNLVVLRSRDDTRPVVQVAAPIAAGEIATAGHFKVAEVDVSDDVFAGLVHWQQAGELEGRVATRPLQPGQLLRPNDLAAPGAPGGLLAMSIPIEPQHAVGGALVAGDRVDLVRVEDGVASYVVRDAEVLSVASGERGSLTGTTSFFVVIAVDSPTALRVAEAIRGGQIEIVRSTGAAATGYRQ
jgi:Flp pilus assembly protein CpaB